MRTWFKVGGVIAALATQVGCIEMDVAVAIQADGSGTLGISTVLQQAFLDVLGKMDKAKADTAIEEKFPSEIPADKRAELAAQGITVNDFQAGTDARGLFVNADLGFARLGDTATIAAGGGALTQVPAMWILDQGGGTYELHLKSKPVQSEMTPPAEEAPTEGKGKGKSSKKDADEQMKMLGELMATIQGFRVGTSVQVPGEIQSVLPSDGVIDGSRVTWTVTGQQLLGAMQNPTEQAAPSDEMVVVFKMPAGQSLPAAALGVAPPPEEPDAAFGPDAAM